MMLFALVLKTTGLFTGQQEGAHRSGGGHLRGNKGATLYMFYRRLLLLRVDSVCSPCIIGTGECELIGDLSYNQLQ